jgi:hypothetical protein
MKRVWAGRPGLNSWQGQEIFLYSTVSRLVLAPTQLSSEWVPGIPFQTMKLPGQEADRSPLFSVKVKSGGVVTFLWHGA